MRLAAIILAGGQGSRFGGANKALLEIGGRRLIDRALDAVRPADPIILSLGAYDFTVPGTVAVHDLDTDYGGPLAGLAAGVDRLAADPPELVLSLAVDTPFFPSDFVARALPLLATAPAVLAAYAGQDYPTNALWRFDAILALPAGLRAGTAPRSLKRHAEAIGAARLDYAPLTPTNPFANANTPQELAFLAAAANNR